MTTGWTKAMLDELLGLIQQTNNTIEGIGSEVKDLVECLDEDLEEIKSRQQKTAQIIAEKLAEPSPNESLISNQEPEN